MGDSGRHGQGQTWNPEETRRAMEKRERSMGVLSDMRGTFPHTGKPTNRTSERHVWRKMQGRTEGKEETGMAHKKARSALGQANERRADQ
jgi:hypothetical protein